MNRKSFLKGMSLATTSTLTPFRKLTETLNAAAIRELPHVACTLIASEARRPFPSDFVTSSSITRTNIKETQTGVPLSLTISVQNLNCTPVPNARVDIWHCNKT